MTIDRSIKQYRGDLFPWCYVVVYIASSTITRGVIRPRTRSVLYHTTDVNSDVHQFVNLF